MYRRWVKIALILVYLVIIAGAMVRMTGSGMGCPDWPKCFGYYIPPTEAEQLEWQPNSAFKKGNVIIVDETLKVAVSDFTTTSNYNTLNWEAYTEHDYAVFNVWHTWIEYINRLIGALSGLAILIMAILSFWKWKFKKRLVYLSWLSVVFIVFQAWLGATVVYSVLAPVKITIHMVMALVIVALLLYLLYTSKETPKTYAVTKGYVNLLAFALILTLIQVVIGTQVRQFVDEQVSALGYEAKSQWLEDPDLSFYVHRSFSILAFIVNAALWYFNRKNNFWLTKINIVFGLIILEIFTGIAMYYFDFPYLSQPLHLVIASLLFGFQFYVLLEAWTRHSPKFVARQ
jgi:cytochrome c oxidase assembly protein subunit 15